MKTIRHTPHRTGILAARALLALSLLVAAATAARAASPSTSAEPKTHTLFMGADLYVQQHKALLRVTDVSAKSFIVDDGHQSKAIPMGEGPLLLQVNPELKLTTNSAEIAGLKAERAYTPANDPYRKFAAQHPGGAGDAVSDLAYGRVDAAMLTQQMAQVGAMAAAKAGVTVAGSSGGNVSGALNSWNNTLNQQSSSDLNSEGYFVGKLEEELAKKEFDAIELRFAISSERTLAKPYVMVMAAYHGPDDKPGTIRNWIYAKELNPVGPEPVKVHILQGGFPKGYTLENYQVHLYNDGEEVATNVAAKRVQLTREEAFEYVLMEYVSDHKGATLPAAPAMGTLPPDFRTRLASGDLAQTYYVKVSKDGEAVETYLDEACSQKVQNPYVTSVMKNLRFKPALDRGRPVEGVIPLKLDQLKI